MNELMRDRLVEILQLARGDTVPEAVAIAVAVEHSFGVVLADDDIDPARLCHPNALTETVLRYLGGS